MRARILAVKLVLAALGALLSLYLWLRAIDGGPVVRPSSPVDLPAVEREAVPTAVPPRPHRARASRAGRRGSHLSVRGSRAGGARGVSFVSFPGGASPSAGSTGSSSSAGSGTARP